MTSQSITLLLQHFCCRYCVGKVGYEYALTMDIKLKGWLTDGFHGLFSLGNWRALHYHAAYWLVDIHITDTFALQILWWKMLWNPSIQ